MENYLQSTCGLPLTKQIVEDYRIIKKQIDAVTKQGKNVFVLMGPNENCFIYTGQTQYSGTGKNARKTNIVTEFDTYSFLPFSISCTHVFGEKYEMCCDEPYQGFLRNTKRMSGYEAIFSLPEGMKPLAKITGNEKYVSAVFEMNEGKIVLLPHPYYEDSYEKDVAWKEAGNHYLKNLFDLEERLASFDDEYIIPTWTQNIAVFNERELIAKKEKTEQKLKRIKCELEKTSREIDDVQKYKRLLTASGIVLEEIVKKSLDDLGFQFLEAEIGRSDVIALYEDTYVVVEIKGVTKSAAEKHSAQLEKWVSQFIEEHEHRPKAILIVNGYCEMPLEDRVEDVFPKQMLGYAISREHLLLTTTQLLCLLIDIRNNPEKKKALIRELISTVGVYSNYDNPYEYVNRC